MSRRHKRFKKRQNYFKQETPGGQQAVKEIETKENYNELPYIKSDIRNVIILAAIIVGLMIGLTFYAEKIGIFEKVISQIESFLK